MGCVGGELDVLTISLILEVFLSQDTTTEDERDEE